MRLSFGIVMACLAMSFSASALWSQTARARTAQVTVQVGGASYLGIGVADITGERAKALNLKEERGAEVNQRGPGQPRRQGRHQGGRRRARV